MHRPFVSAQEFLRRSRAEAVVFDMDGVLADTESFHVEAWLRVVEKATGVRPDVNAVRATFGQTNDLIIPALWRHVGRPVEGSLVEIGRRKESYYREAAAGKVRPLPGIERFLAWLCRHGVGTAIGTSGPRENVDFLLKEFGWSCLFDAITDRSRFAGGKPAPDCFLRAAHDLGIHPRSTVVFEDSFHGLLAARRGGFVVAGIASTHPAHRLWPFARWVFRDFADIAC